MTQDEIIEMANEAGIIQPQNVIKTLEVFAKLVAQHERNEIIEILDASTGYVHMDAIREREQA
jgi:hypothetical protein